MPEMLIIDDDLVLCETLSLMVEGMGLATQSAQTLAQGLEMARAGAFDVVLLDVRMPDGNGLDALSTLRTTPSRPEVIIITGEGNADGRRRRGRWRGWAWWWRLPSPSSWSCRRSASTLIPASSAGQEQPASTQNPGRSGAWRLKRSAPSPPPAFWVSSAS